jgi:hypothetical protein
MYIIIRICTVKYCIYYLYLFFVLLCTIYDVIAHCVFSNPFVEYAFSTLDSPLEIHDIDKLNYDVSLSSTGDGGNGNSNGSGGIPNDHGANSNGNGGGNSNPTNLTAHERIGNCFHDDPHRVPYHDGPHFTGTRADCSFCDQVAINGVAGKEAIVCSNCGAIICQNCNME